jgi:hypothetical protein
MDQVISQANNPGVKKRRGGTINRKISPVSERTSLETHVDLCELRYQQLDVRMDRVEQQIDALGNDVKELKQTNDQQFNEIKRMLSGAKDEKFKVMVTVSGTIIVSLLGVMGYLITHLPG